MIKVNKLFSFSSRNSLKEIENKCFVFISSFSSIVNAVDWLRYSLSIYQIEVSFSCVCLVIDHEFRHNIPKLAVKNHIVLSSTVLDEPKLLVAF